MKAGSRFAPATHRRLRKNSVEFSTIPLSLHGSLGWHGNALSIIAIFAACWKATRGYTVKLKPDLSAKAGTPCVTASETQPKTGVAGTTLAVRDTMWEDPFYFLESQ